jgi:hypothetical protein
VRALGEAHSGAAERLSRGQHAAVVASVEAPRRRQRRQAQLCHQAVKHPADRPFCIKVDRPWWHGGSGANVRATARRNHSDSEVDAPRGWYSGVALCPLLELDQLERWTGFAHSRRRHGALDRARPWQCSRCTHGPNRLVRCAVRKDAGDRRKQVGRDVGPMGAGHPGTADARVSIIALVLSTVYVRTDRPSVSPPRPICAARLSVCVRRTMSPAHRRRRPPGESLHPGPPQRPRLLEYNDGGSGSGSGSVHRTELATARHGTVCPSVRQLHARASL